MSKSRPRIGIVDWHLKRDFYSPLTSAYDAEWRDVSCARLAHRPPELDLVLINDETWHFCVAALANLQRLGIPTLHLPDGSCEWRNTWNRPLTAPLMRPVFATKIACLGHSQARLLESWGNGGKCVVTGSPRFDWLVGKGPRSPRQSTLLIATARQPFFQEWDKQAVIASLMDLKSWLEEHTYITPVWRVTAGLDRVIGVRNGLTVPLADQLSNVDAVISTPSNVILESMAHGLPVAMLDYTNSPAYIRAAWSVTARVHIHDAVHGLLAADPRRMDWQQALLADQLECHSRATPRVLEVMESLMGSDSLPRHPPAAKSSRELELLAEIAHLRKALSLRPTQVAYRSLCELKRWLRGL